MLQFTNYRVRLFDSTYRSAKLDKQEYCLFQEILLKFFNDMAQSSLRLFYSEHKIQYIPLIYTTGRKLVLINGFCKYYSGFNMDSWKKELVRPADGGLCYFLGTIDLTDKVIKDLWFNGEARIKKLKRLDAVQVCDATEAK